VRGQQVGERAGGPAGQGRDPDDEDENGHSNWIEHVADANGRDKDNRKLDSLDIEEQRGDKVKKVEDESEPNFWFGIRRKLREPLAE
jgi:hypothetical protein